MDQDTLDEYSQAIHTIETGNERDPWRALGPRTYKGDFAVGRYQVMASEVPEWTKQAFGKPMSWQQFRSNPAAQQALFEQRFGGDAAKYGNPYDAASIWFTGQPYAVGKNRSDRGPGFAGHTGSQYVAGFHKALMAAKGQTKALSKQSDDYLSQFEHDDEPAAAPSAAPGKAPEDDYLSQFEEDTKPEAAPSAAQPARAGLVTPAEAGTKPPEAKPEPAGLAKLFGPLMDSGPEATDLAKAYGKDALAAVVQTKKHLGGNAGLFVLGGLLGTAATKGGVAMARSKILQGLGAYGLAHQLGLDEPAVHLLTSSIKDLIKVEK